MLKEVDRFKELFTSSFEIDDEQAIDIVLATAVTHKVGVGEMLWLRIIGASGTGKTELLRTLAGQKGYCTQIEGITPAAIRRGYAFKRKKEYQRPLLERINRSLVITKEFAVILTKDLDSQKEIYGLLRGVHDGTLDVDYGSEEGHLRQESRFDWILGTTQFVERQRQLETLLGSRFIDLRWGSPILRNVAVKKARANDGVLEGIRAGLVRAMTDIIEVAKVTPKPQGDYIDELANIAAAMRTPVERDSRTKDIIEIPDIELGTRMGQALSRIGRGLMMIGVDEQDLRPYLIRIVFDCMTKIRASIIKAWMAGLTKQSEVGARLELTQSAISRVIDELRILRWNDSWLEALRADNQYIGGGQTMDNRKIELTEQGHQAARRIELAFMAHLKEEYDKAEAAGDTQKMAELERLVEDVPEEER